MDATSCSRRHTTPGYGAGQPHASPAIRQVDLAPCGPCLPLGDGATAAPASPPDGSAAADATVRGGGEARATEEAAAADGAPRLLDKGDETRLEHARRPRLTKAQLRARDAIQYRLATWHRQGHEAFFLTLTSAPESPPGTINRHFEVLRRRIAAYLGIPRASLEYVRVTTREGHGVIHAVLGVPRSGLQRPGFLLPFELLQKWWTELHGAFMVNVKPIRRGATDRRKVSGYIVSQYLANQEGAYLRLSQSRCAIDWRAIAAEFKAHAWPNRWDIVSRRNRLGQPSEARPPRAAVDKGQRPAACPVQGQVTAGFIGGHPGSSREAQRGTCPSPSPAADAGLADLRIRVWKRWCWRKYRDALRDLLGNGVTVLWGHGYTLVDSTLEAHALSLPSSERREVAQA